MNAHRLRGFILFARFVFLAWRSRAASAHAEHCADVFNGACYHADVMEARADRARRELIAHGMMGESL
jgi:hypothetical protein